ncbi:MAG TPA: YncE family protein [Acidimicrobiales bacterium]|nr:YncE family protein [Acidimicrobiales bacterium]
MKHGARPPALRATLPLLAVVAAGALGAACGAGRPAAVTTTTTLPPLPPVVVALVTRIGAASSLGSGDTVVPVDVTAGSGSGPAAPIRVGAFPDAIAVAPGGAFAYVTSYAAGTLTPIDLATDTALPPIRVGNGPAGIAIAPDGKRAYVTDAGSSPLGDTVTPVDLETRTALAPITVGAGPQGIAITPDGSTAYVADAGAIVNGQVGPVGDTVTPIDLATRTALAPITVGNAPTAVVVAPDGSAVYVANASSGSVTPIPIGSGAAGTSMAVDGSPQALAFAAAGSSTLYVALAPSGVSAGGSLTAVSVVTGHVLRATGVCASPSGVAVTGATAWVTCTASGTIVPVDLRSGVKGAPISVGPGPYAIALTTRAQGGPASARSPSG